MASEEMVAESVEGGEGWFQKELEYCQPTGIEDTADELKRWAFSPSPWAL